MGELYMIIPTAACAFLVLVVAVMGAVAMSERDELKDRLEAARVEIKKHGGPNMMSCEATDNPWDDGYYTGLRVALVALDNAMGVDTGKENK